MKIMIALVPTFYYTGSSRSPATQLESNQKKMKKVKREIHTVISGHTACKLYMHNALQVEQVISSFKFLCAKSLVLWH